jgi:ABC-type nitrate/sulfonate/bicarbonate transport system substrate-binding protein
MLQRWLKPRLGLLVLLLAHFLSDEVAFSVERVRAGIPSPSVNTLLFYYAKDKKLFEKHGLDVELLQISSPLQLAALASGELDFIFTTSIGIQGIARGMPFKVVAIFNRAPLFSLLSGQSSPKALEGKRIAVARIGSGPYWYGVQMLEEIGVDPKTVNWIQTGDTALGATALEQGRVEGAVLSPPHSEMLARKGFKILKRSKDVITGAPGNGLVTTRAKIQSQPDRIANAVKAIMDSIRSIRRDRKGTIAYIMKKLNVTQEIAEDTYEEMLGVMSDDLTIDDERLKKYLETLHSRGETRKLLTPSDVADASILKAIKQGS